MRQPADKKLEFKIWFLKPAQACLLFFTFNILSKIDVFRVPTGSENVSKYPNLIAELMMRRWADADLIKIREETFSK